MNNTLTQNEVTTSTLNETNMSVNASGGPQSPKTFNVVKNILIFLLVLFLSLFTYLGFSYFIKNKINPTQAVLIENNTKILSDFKKESSLENQNKYINDVDKIITKDNLSTSTKNDLLLKKALVASVVRGDNSNRNMASDIFKKIIENEEKDTLSNHNRDYSIAAFIHMHFQCCEARPFSEELPNYFTKHKERGYNNPISKLFTLLDLTNLVSDQGKNDTTIVANSILIKSQLLDQYSEKLKEEDKKKLVISLGEDLILFKKTEPKTFTDDTSTKYEPTILYAYGYDIYHYNSTGIISSSTNKNIDTNYQKATEDIKLAINDSNNDKNAFRLMLMYNSARYIKSIDRRYTANEKKKEKEDSINIIMNLIKESSTVKQVADSYFKKVPLNKESNLGYFAYLSKDYPVISDYLKSINVIIK